jgi:ribosomal protein S18 acetylase RimI-like enzyme
MATNLTMRPYGDEEDYWRIRRFLRETFLLNDRRERCWPVARLDYWRWFVIECCEICDSMERVTFLWEATDGRLAAVLNQEGHGEAWLHVHPALRTPELELEMLTVAEEHLGSPVGRPATNDQGPATSGQGPASNGQGTASNGQEPATNSQGQHRLTVWASEHDTQRQSILVDRGYSRGDWPDHKHRWSLQVPIPAAPPAPGYTVRALGDAQELPARAWLSWRAFHPNEPDEAYSGWEWYHSIQRLPLYRRDLDLVAVTSEGELASFCTLWYDDATRSGYFEPVGTAPEHQQRGLAKAVMCEGLRRLQRMGGTVASVGGFTTAANALYTSVMGPDVELYERWEKVW